MADELKGKTIAIIATDGVEQVELTEPRKAVENAGAITVLLSPDTGEIQAMNSDINPADTFTVDKAIGDASPDDYDGLILPGGTVNADRLRLEDTVVSFVQDHFRSGKPGGRDLPWAVGAGGGRSGARSHADLVPEPPDRYPQRRRHLGR